jgi:hypothetical protein
LIAALLALDALSRFFPLDPLCFQAWECLTRYQEPGAIFEANRQFRSDRTHGNLSNMANLPALRQLRPQVFTTDALGFRNARNLAGTKIDGVIIGDSFVAGYGNSDDETLPVQLSATSGLRFYNGAGPYAYLATTRWLKSKLGFRRGYVIVVWTENVPLAYLQDAEARAQRPDGRTRMVTAILGDRAERMRSLLRGWWFTSPVRIVAEKAYLSISNDRVLPNVYAQKVVQRRLKTGEPILFYPPDVSAHHDRGDLQASGDYLARLGQDIRGEGFDPVVVLAPSKYTVYYPLLDGPSERVAVDSGQSAVAARLRAAGITTIDLTRAFQEQAAVSLAAGRYLYWLDDTHWNAEGIAVAARLIQQQLHLETSRDAKESS